MSGPPDTASDRIAEPWGVRTPYGPGDGHGRYKGARQGGLGLLRDLHDLYLLATECDISWTLIGQAAKGARVTELSDVVERCEGETTVQLAWLRTRMKQAAPQPVVVT